MILRGFILALAMCPAIARAEITAARFETPTDAYGHGAVGNGEYAQLRVTTDRGDRLISLNDAVFEDSEPRLVDLDGDGQSEVLTVISDFNLGAAIWVVDETPDGLQTHQLTDPIGQRNRWLAIAGAADLDGDGLIEIVYVDRPHLTRVLRVIEVDGNFDVRDEAAAQGYTNHHLGSPVIEGGIRDCGDGLVILTADADWQDVLQTRLVGGTLRSSRIRAYSGPQSVRCP